MRCLVTAAAGRQSGHPDQQDATRSPHALENWYSICSSHRRKRGGGGA
jgi:hypothetical protein